MTNRKKINLMPFYPDKINLEINTEQFCCLNRAMTHYQNLLAIQGERYEEMKVEVEEGRSKLDELKKLYFDIEEEILLAPIVPELMNMFEEEYKKWAENHKTPIDVSK